MRAILVLAALLAGMSAARAHAMLEQATPGAGAKLGAPPKDVTLQFSEALEPTFSGLSVTDRSGRTVAAGTPDTHDSTMHVALRALKPGTYRVTWHAVSIDAHRTEGAFSFTVKP
jgi:methionine-rich copper-binding protein CopC